MNTFKEKIAFWLKDSKTLMGKTADITIILINLSACVVFVLESLPAYAGNERLFQYIEWIFILLFSTEYALRYWVAPRKVRYVFSLMSFIDILSILPSILAFGDFRFLRVFRVFRIFRFSRFFQNHIFFFGEIHRIHLHAVRIVFSIFALVFVASGMIYTIEGDANPELFPTFFDAVYFSLVTITTVGYGDITPVSFYGKLATLFIITMGIIIIPWHVGNLMRDIFQFQREYVTCKNCGLEYHDHDAIHCKHCGTIIYRDNHEESQAQIPLKNR